MTDNEIFEEVRRQVTDPKVLDLLRSGLADPNEIEDVKRAIRYGEASMKNPMLRDKLYKIFDRLLNVVKDDSTTRQMVKQDLRRMQRGDQAMSENLDTANVEKAVKHDCAKHVVHEEWGRGQCIPGEHSLQDDGTVTHYDVMFDHGIERDVPVGDLTVTVSESHMHAKRKKSMMETAAGNTLEPSPSSPPKLADITPQEGGKPAFVEKKDKPRMPMERLKAIMEKRKSEAYKAMLRSQGKLEESEQVDEAKAKMTDAHKKIAREVHRGLKSEEQMSQVHGDRIRHMHSLLRKRYGSNWRALAGINEEIEQVDEGAASHHGVAIDSSRLDRPKNISGLARKHGGQHVYRDPHGSVYVFSSKDGAKSFKDVVGSAASHIKADQTRKIMKMKELGEDVEQVGEAVRITGPGMMEPEKDRLAKNTPEMKDRRNRIAAAARELRYFGNRPGVKGLNRGRGGYSPTSIVAPGQNLTARYVKAKKTTNEEVEQIDEVKLNKAIRALRRINSSSSEHLDGTINPKYFNEPHKKQRYNRLYNAIGRRWGEKGLAAAAKATSSGTKPTTIDKVKARDELTKVSTWPVDAKRREKYRLSDIKRARKRISKKLPG